MSYILTRTANIVGVISQRGAVAFRNLTTIISTGRPGQNRKSPIKFSSRTLDWCRGCAVYESLSISRRA